MVFRWRGKNQWESEMDWGGSFLHKAYQTLWDTYGMYNLYCFAY